MLKTSHTARADSNDGGGPEMRHSGQPQALSSDEQSVLPSPTFGHCGLSIQGRERLELDELDTIIDTLFVLHGLMDPTARAPPQTRRRRLSYTVLYERSYHIPLLV